MDGITYDSAQLFIESATSLEDKICKIDLVISALLTSALKAAETGNITEYTLDDGQTRIQTEYRDPAAVSRSIRAFQTIRQDYINQRNGRTFRLNPGENFNRHGNGHR